MLALAVLVAAAVGDVPTSLRDVAAVVANHLLHTAARVDPQTDAIIWLVRIPRILTALLVGSALATAGTAFQGLFRNPLADPAIVGTSAGAVAGTVLAFLLPAGALILGFSAVTLCAFVGATIAVWIVMLLGRIGGRVPTGGLLLAGFAVSALLNAGSALAMAFSDRLREMQYWMLGNLSQTTGDQLAVVGPLTLLGLLALQALAWDMNVLLLGEEHAAYLGLRVARQRLLILLAGSLLTALAVSISGLIGFVGLIVPHISRLLFGANHRLLLPVSAIVGGLFLLVADTLARLVLAQDLPVGIVTALAGAPWFLWLLRHKAGRQGIYA